MAPPRFVVFRQRESFTWCWWREFDHHGQPLCDVVQPQVGDLGQLAQPVAHGVLVHSSLQANGYKVILTRLRSAPLDQCTVTAVPVQQVTGLGPPRPATGASKNNSF